MRMRLSLPFAVAFVVALGHFCGHLFSEAAEADSKAEASRKQTLMRAKLDVMHRVVDGLVHEDFAALETQADRWLQICESTEWKVRRDPVYLHYSTDFQETVGRLRKAARAKNIEGATFAYVHVTVSCMACHQHVRGVVQVAPQDLPGTDAGRR